MTRTDKLRRRLLADLELRGWRRTAVEPRREDWRRGELWQLESLWPPRGLRAWLLLLNNWVDRDDLSHAAVCAGPPLGLEAEALAFEDLSGGRRSAYAAVLATLAAWRDRPGGEAGADEEEGPPTPGWDETAWLTSADAGRMLEFAQDKLTERQLRLFACACCRRLPHLMAVRRNVLAVEAAERYADGLVPKREMRKARQAAQLHLLSTFEPLDEALQAVRATALLATRERHRQLADVLRDIAGNPFRPVTARHAWRAWGRGTVVRLAQALYDEGRFEEMPVLADALEEAGCADPELLGHLRGPGPHARGCWALDLILGRR